MKIGDIEIEKGIFLAPMEDVSDYPFRMICKKFGADVVYSEFISSEALIRDAEKAFKKYIELVPDSPNSYDSYAEFLMTLGS